MTGLKYVVMQIHPRDQSRMNVAILWKETGQIDKGMFTDQYYQGINYKNINTKRQPCTMRNVKHSKCVDEFYMNQLNCSLPWLKSYNGNLEKCWDKHKIFDLVNLISNVTNISSGFYEEMKSFGCVENCRKTFWQETKSSSGKFNDKSNLSEVFAIFPAVVKESRITDNDYDFG